MIRSVVCIFFTLALYVSQLGATHILGGRFEYSVVRISAGQVFYKLSLFIYRDCKEDGTPNEVPFDKNVLVCLYDNAGNLIKAETLPLISEAAVVAENPNSCLDVPKYCVKKGTYSKEIFFTSSLSNVKVVWQRCCRGNLKNLKLDINGFDYQGMSAIAEFPDGGILNQSCVVSSSPVVVVCSSDSVKWNLNVTDADGDSLSYRWVRSYLGASVIEPLPQSCKQNFSVPAGVDYVSGYDSSSIFGKTSGVSNLNETTGDVLLYTPDSGWFNGAIEITEWRNGKAISKSRSEFSAFNQDRVHVDIANFEKRETRQALTIYPNPVSHELWFEYIGCGKCDWSIRNCQGQLIQSGKLENDKQQLNMSQLPSGVYTLALTNDSLVYTSNFIKD